MEIRERWAQPVEILDHSTNEDGETVTFNDGRTFVEEDLTIPPDQLEQIRIGRRCFNCKEPFEVPWPETCNALKTPGGLVVGCHYPVKAQQLIDYEAYVGERMLKRIEPNRRVNEELERMKEHAAYEEKTGIVLPDSVKFPTETIREGS